MSWVASRTGVDAKYRCFAGNDARHLRKPKAEYYRIGYTSWSADRKRGVYGKRHLVILADRLTRDAALKLEQALQERACGIGGKRCDRSSMLYCKYDPNMIWKTAQ